MMNKGFARSFRRDQQSFLRKLFPAEKAVNTVSILIPKFVCNACPDFGLMKAYALIVAISAKNVQIKASVMSASFLQ